MTDYDALENVTPPAIVNRYIRLENAVNRVLATALPSHDGGWKISSDTIVILKEALGFPEK